MEDINTMSEQLSGVDRLSQDEAHYTVTAKSADVSCATCRWFDTATDYCGIVKSTPVDIAADGGCDRHELKAGALPEPVEVAEVIKSEPETLEPPIELPVAVSETQAPTIIQRVKNLFTPKPDDSAFQVFKAADGKHYWIARYTNNFEDRDKEILSQKAHESYVARVDLGFVPPPELWAYHTKGSRHGQADQVWMHENFVFAIGHFDNTPEGEQAIKGYQSLKGKIELSHGFTFPKWALKDGVYESYNTFEISTLPVNAASNPFTSFEEIDTMARTEKQTEWIRKIGGDALVKRVEDNEKASHADADVIKALGVDHKDFVEINTTTESSKAADNGEVNKLVVEMIGVQAEMIETIDSLKSEIKTFTEAEATKTNASKTTIEQLTADLAAVKAQLSARPKTASTDPATLIEKKDLPAEVVNANVEIDNFWHVPVKGV